MRRTLRVTALLVVSILYFTAPAPVKAGACEEGCGIGWAGCMVGCGPNFDPWCLGGCDIGLGGCLWGCSTL
jgi:hypothetical protein